MDRAFFFSRRRAVGRAPGVDSKGSLGASLFFSFRCDRREGGEEEGKRRQEKEMGREKRAMKAKSSCLNVSLVGRVRVESGKKIVQFLRLEGGRIMRTVCVQCAMMQRGVKIIIVRSEST